MWTLSLVENYLQTYEGASENLKTLTEDVVTSEEKIKRGNDVLSSRVPIKRRN